MTREADDLALIVIKMIKAGARGAEEKAVSDAREKDDPFGVGVARGIGGFVETWLDNVEKKVKSRRRR